MRKKSKSFSIVAEKREPEQATGEVNIREMFLSLAWSR